MNIFTSEMDQIFVETTIVSSCKIWCTLGVFPFLSVLSFLVCGMRLTWKFCLISFYAYVETIWDHTKVFIRICYFILFYSNQINTKIWYPHGHCVSGFESITSQAAFHFVFQKNVAEMESCAPGLTNWN